LGGVLFAGGALVAAAFPAAAGLYAAGGDRVAASAATLYAADLAGAAGGALLTSLVLIPVLGMAATAIAAGLWAVTAAVLSGPFIAPTPA
jgi:spermidine synthase